MMGKKKITAEIVQDLPNPHVFVWHLADGTFHIVLGRGAEYWRSNSVGDKTTRNWFTTVAFCRQVQDKVGLDIGRFLMLGSVRHTDFELRQAIRQTGRKIKEGG